MVKRHVGGTGSRIFAFPSWRWLALWGSLLALQAQAEVLQDPTMPLAGSGSAASVAKEAGLPRLQSVILGNGPLAGARRRATAGQRGGRILQHLSLGQRAQQAAQQCQPLSHE